MVSLGIADECMRTFRCPSGTLVTMLFGHTNADVSGWFDFGIASSLCMLVQRLCKPSRFTQRPSRNVAITDRDAETLDVSLKHHLQDRHPRCHGCWNRLIMSQVYTVQVGNEKKSGSHRRANLDARKRIHLPLDIHMPLCLLSRLPPFPSPFEVLGYAWSAPYVMFQASLRSRYSAARDVVRGWERARSTATVAQGADGRCVCSCGTQARGSSRRRRWNNLRV
nr:hypothetical protein CFP56_79092 [Quercus suber]